MRIQRQRLVPISILLLGLATVPLMLMSGKSGKTKVMVNFQNSRAEHVRKAELLLNAVAERGTSEKLLEFIFRSPHDWIACDVTA